jgi:hypothetical protein
VEGYPQPEGTRPGCRVSSRHGQKLYGKVGCTRRRDRRGHVLSRANAGELVRRARLIVLLGIGSVALARYHYAKGHDRRSRRWWDRPGTPAWPSTSAGRRSPPSRHRLRLDRRPDHDGKRRPAHRAQDEQRSGEQRHLGKFASEYTGLKLTNTSVQYPGGTAYKNGQKCAKPALPTPAEGRGPGPLVDPVVASQKSGSEVKQLGGQYTSKRRPTSNFATAS